MPILNCHLYSKMPLFIAKSPPFIAKHCLLHAASKILRRSAAPEQLSRQQIGIANSAQIRSTGTAQLPADPPIQHARQKSQTEQLSRHIEEFPTRIHIIFAEEFPTYYFCREISHMNR